MGIRERTVGLTGSLRGEATIAVSIGVMNVATYAFTIVAARVLGPRPYGAFASLMATLLVLGVFQLGLQATAARRIAADPEHVAQIERTVLAVTLRASLVLGLVTLACSPLLDAVLRIDNLATTALVAVVMVPMTLMGGQAGVLQGERRWGALAAVYLANGIPRLLIGSALVLWRPTEAAAMAGVALGALVPVVVGWVLLRTPRHAGRTSDDHSLRPVANEVIRNSQALLAFFALSNIDIVVARNVLTEHDAGLYAGGLILTKAVLFLPQFVVVVAFPSMATAHERTQALRRSLGAVAFLGLCATVGALLLSSLALIFVGGGEYAEIEPLLWRFAVLGMLLAMLQLLVYSVVARQGRYAVYLVWAALLLIATLGLLARSVETLVNIVIAVDVLLLLALLIVTLTGVGRPRPGVTAAADGRPAPGRDEAST